MPARSALLVLPLLVACHSDPINPDPTGSGGGSSSSAATTISASASSGTGGASHVGDATSGSRLKVRHLTADDTATATAGFYDSERMEPCSFRLAADQKQRCLPDDAKAINTFVDGTCATPLLVSACATPPKYVSIAAPCTDPVLTAIYATGATAISAVYYELHNGACESVPVKAGQVLHSVVSVAPSEFVGANETLDP